MNDPIHIKKSHEGLLTQKAREAGKTPIEFAHYVLAHQDIFHEATIKEAQFAVKCGRVEEMKRHTAYLKYVLRHKWFVLIASWKVGLPLWRGIIHDWHKFLPSEWFPYAYAFYEWDGSKRYKETEQFNVAWNHHQKRGKHHWQYWILTFDRGDSKPIDMHPVFIHEMIADWWGAGKGQNGVWDAVTWYNANKEKIILSLETRKLLEKWLFESERKFVTPKDTAKRIRILGY